MFRSYLAQFGWSEWLKMMRKGNLAPNELRLQGDNGGKSEMNEMSNEREKRTMSEPSAIFLTLKHAIL